MGTTHANDYLWVPGSSETVLLSPGEQQIIFALVSHEDQSRLRF